MTSATTVGREIVQIVEFLQPFCGNTFGVAPCTASASHPDTKCFNTYSTCQDQANFTTGTRSIFFSRGNVADRGVEGAPYILPLLKSVSTQPTKINLAGASDTSEALGNRAAVTLTFADMAHNDYHVDPYAAGRSWNTLTEDRGTFWTRWLVRNKYKLNMQINVYEGYTGQTLAEMSKRTYFFESVGSLNANGLSFKAYDPLFRLNKREAQAPEASPGVLYQAINGSQNTLNIAGAVEADYPATGTLRIDDEIMTYTGRSYNGKFLAVTGVTRGTDNSTAATHAVDATVQKCIRYTDDTVDDVVAELLEDYAGFSSSLLDKANWATEVDGFLALYPVSNLITEPTPVNELLSQLQEQLQFYIWWHEKDALVKMKVLRGLSATPDTLTDTDDVLAGGYSYKEKPRERASQIWVYYNPKDYTSSRTDGSIYDTAVWPDLASEGVNAHGSQAIRKVYGNWLSTRFMTRKVGRKVLNKYVDVPREVTIRVDAKNRDTWTGDVIKLNHYMERYDSGARAIRTWLIIQAQETEPGETVEYVLQEITVYGVLNFIMASGASDYSPGGSNPTKNAFIGDSSGELSDGSDCARISV